MVYHLPEWPEDADINGPVIDWVPDDEDLAQAEEFAWYDELNRGYARDRI